MNEIFKIVILFKELIQNNQRNLNKVPCKKEQIFEGGENLGQVRRWAIQLKGDGNGGGRKISFPYNSVTIEDRKKNSN